MTADTAFGAFAAQVDAHMPDHAHRSVGTYWQAWEWTSRTGVWKIELVWRPGEPSIFKFTGGKALLEIPVSAGGIAAMFALATALDAGLREPADRATHTVAAGGVTHGPSPFDPACTGPECRAAPCSIR